MGVILAAAAPPGAISNYYALLARARVALAVTLTAVSSLGAAIITPLVASIAHWFALRESAAFTLPAAKMLQQTMIGLLLPVLVGMAVRHFAPSWTARHETKLRGLAERHQPGEHPLAALRRARPASLSPHRAGRKARERASR